MNCPPCIYSRRIGFFSLLPTCIVNRNKNYLQASALHLTSFLILSYSAPWFLYQLFRQAAIISSTEQVLWVNCTKRFDLRSSLNVHQLEEISHTLVTSAV